MNDQQIAVMTINRELLRIVIRNTEQILGVEAAFPVTIRSTEVLNTIDNMLAEAESRRGSRVLAGGSREQY